MSELINLRSKPFLLFCAAALPLAGQALAADTKTILANPGTASKTAEAPADQLVAKGKGVQVKRSELDEAVAKFKADADAQGKTITPEQSAMIEPNLLDRLIQTQILISRATDAEKAKASMDATKQFHDAMTNAPSEEIFNAQLKKMGMTKDQLVSTMTEQATAEAVVLRELKIDITDADAKKFYEDTNNAANFQEKEMVRASHILLMTQDPLTKNELSKVEKEAKHKTMEGLLKRARAGEDFGKLAKEFSEDPGSKDKGGEYTFPRGQMVPEFEATAFALKPNEVSDIVTTSFGYHIIKLSEHIPAGKVALDKVAPRIKNYLTQQEFARLAPDYLTKIKKEANVEILDTKLKPREAPSGETNSK